VFTDTTTELPLLPVVSPRADMANETWKLKYLYDGGCSVCKALVKMLKSRKGHENIYFEDIASPSFSSVENEGILYDSAMETIHVIKKDRSILQGMDALTSLYEEASVTDLERRCASRVWHVCNALEPSCLTSLT
jgi:predicted DCC family thiol-disulfide oxidoreductase YuxK